jgi:hypothetical protein
MHCAFNLKRHPITKEVMSKLPNKERDLRCKQTAALYATAYYLSNLLTPEAIAEQGLPDVLWVGDDKSEPYWRHAEYWRLLEAGEIKHSARSKQRGYKGGRNSCPYQQWLTKRLYKYTNAWTIPGYEADDVAAAVVKTCSADRKVYLLTVDTDWMQLINENTTWVCVKGFEPPIRTLENLPAWFQPKLDKGSAKVREQLDASKPTDIITWKVLTGDSSDNLPKGTPRYMFDLLEPKAGHKLWELLDVPALVASKQNPVNADSGVLKNEWVLENDGILPTPVYVL